MAKSYHSPAAKVGKMKGCVNFLHNENHLAYLVHCFSHRLSLILLKLCKFTLFCNIVSILTKGFCYEAITRNIA